MARVSKRNITINDVHYVWTLRGNRIDTDPVHIKVHKASNNHSILYIDPYSWNFEVRPEFIRKAIVFALENNWLPAIPKNDIYISMEGSNFILLPEGVKFKTEISENKND